MSVVKAVLEAAMPDGARYDVDFFLWTRDQAERLRMGARAGSNLALDWENLAEEIESVGRSEQRELVYRLTIIVAHLLKLRFSSAPLPRNGWIETVIEQRGGVEALILDSPSLRPRIAELEGRVSATAAESAGRALRQFGELTAAALIDASSSREMFEQALDADFFPHMSP